MKTIELRLSKQKAEELGMAVLTTFYFDDVFSGNPVIDSLTTAEQNPAVVNVSLAKYINREPNVFENFQVKRVRKVLYVAKEI